MCLSVTSDALLREDAPFLKSFASFCVFSRPNFACICRNKSSIYENICQKMLREKADLILYSRLSTLAVKCVFKSPDSRLGKQCVVDMSL